MNRSSKTIFISGVVMMVAGLLALGAALGVFASADSAEAKLENSHRANVEQMILNADGATRGKAMSLATGRVSAEVEGLFVLDHLTGSLSCIILSPRTGEASGLYSTNVTNDLGAVKAGGQQDYLMATGYIDVMGGRQGQNRPAECVVYVADGNTGQVAAYSMLYNRTALENGQEQGGALNLLWQGGSRPNTARRDQD